MSNFLIPGSSGLLQSCFPASGSPVCTVLEGYSLPAIFHLSLQNFMGVLPLCVSGLLRSVWNFQKLSLNHRVFTTETSLARHNLLLVSPVGLDPHLLFLQMIIMASRRICSTIFPGAVTRLTSMQLPPCPSWRQEWCLPFSHLFMALSISWSP